MKPDYILELPLPGDVSSTFKSFVKDLGTPVKFDCLCQFFKGRLKLSSANMHNTDGSIGRTASVRPRDDVETCEISRFASKFNVAMSLSSDSRDIWIEVVSPAKGLTVLRATITIKTLAETLALTNIWTIIDTSTR